MQKRYSKDPKCHVITIEEFYKSTDYLGNIKKRLWKDEKPCESTHYFKITNDKLICIYYGRQLTNFGFDTKEKLEKIDIAYRDGITEFKYLNDRLAFLNEEKLKHKYSKKIIFEVSKIESLIKWAKKNFPPFLKDKSLKENNFQMYLEDTGLKFDTSWFGKKVVVIDVETNGIRKSNDDILSLSIYNPSTGICYNRFFPLDLQPCVLTSFINGINDKDLENQIHWNQSEVDDIVEYFDLKNAVILSYSGGRGMFDADFIVNYCKRHNLQGFENLEYSNIKSCFPEAPFGCEGQLTKDNLCQIFKINGISNVHSSMNDCLLEWQLFQKIYKERIFLIGEHFYSFSDEYIVPVTYLIKNEKLYKYANLERKSLVGKAEKIYEYKFPKAVLNDIKKFPTNVTGITIENSINYLLGAKKQNNVEFLKKNKNCIKYVGSLSSDIEKIPIFCNDDGTIKTANVNYQDYVDNVNFVTKIIEKNLKETIEVIKTKIFNETEIRSQELVISDDKKIFALCDLSSDKSILEIKTFNVLDNYGHISPNVTKQIYYEKNNRNAFVLSIVFETHLNYKTFQRDVEGLEIDIYSVEVKEERPESFIINLPYKSIDLLTYFLIRENPQIRQTELCQITHRNINAVNRTIKILKEAGVIEKQGFGVTTTWKILKDIKKGDTYPVVVNPY